MLTNSSHTFAKKITKSFVAKDKRSQQSSKTHVRVFSIGTGRLLLVKAKEIIVIAKSEGIQDLGKIVFIILSI